MQKETDIILQNYLRALNLIYTQARTYLYTVYQHGNVFWEIPNMKCPAILGRLGAV